MSHKVSHELEMVVRRALGGEGRGALGGVANADMIDIGFGFAALCGAVAPLYVNVSVEQQVEIGEFLRKYYDLNGGKCKDHVELVRQATKDLDDLLEKWKK